VLAALLGVIFMLISMKVGSPSWRVPWLGEVIGTAALLGALFVFWRAGALATRYIVLFLLALALAVAVGPQRSEMSCRLQGIGTTAPTKGNARPVSGSHVAEARTEAIKDRAAAPTK
jgi:hypothetical protein